MSADTLSPDCLPRLPRGIRLKLDETRNEWLLLAPERVIKPNQVAVEILKRCTGKASLAGIVDDLATAFAADRALIDRDVRALIFDLSQKRLLDL